VRFLASAPNSNPVSNNADNTTTPDHLEVFILLDIISFRINTYTVVEASLKTRHFIPFRMRTYGKSLRKPFRFRTSKNTQGGGAPE
jgi:hypothetical protein